MATEVETPLPNNPLLKQEDQEHEERSQSDIDGDSELVVEEKSVKLAKEENDSQAKVNLNQEEHPAEIEEQEKAEKTELTAAPPPKVNPWTKKMNTVSSVNGQPQHGVYKPLYYMNIDYGMSNACNK